MGLRSAQQYSAQRKTVEELVKLFAGDGVSLSESAVSFEVPPAALTLTRDQTVEKAMAAQFLGDDLTSSDEGGGIFMFTSPVGQAVFRSAGSFEITGNLGENSSVIVQNFCKDYGYEAPPTWFNPLDNGITNAQQIYQGYSVEGSSVTFLIEDGELCSVSGTFLPAAFSVSQSERLLSAPTALIAFLEARRTSGAVVSAVTNIYPCYQYQNTTSAMALTPIWCIVTDTVNYYVNCSSGAVTHA